MTVVVFGMLTLLVFILDARAPLGANVPLLYNVPVLIAIWHARERGILAPVICTGLIVLRVWWFPAGDWSLGLFNRALTILALWSTAILLIQFRRTDARLREQADMARFSEMAMVIAHELRNALAGIRTAVDVFGARLSGSERDKAVKQEMANRIQSLEHFVADLLTLSRPVRPVLTPTPLLPMIRRAVESLKNDPPFAGVTVDITGANPMASMDEPLIESALVHLLRNAAQAMNGTGVITIDVTSGAGAVCVSIRDAGQGIPAEIRQKIFDPFFTTSSRGRGLGLAIAKRAIEHHGGSLELVSDAGAGTTATVRLPYA